MRQPDIIGDRVGRDERTTVSLSIKDSGCPAWVRRTLGWWRLGRFPITSSTSTESPRAKGEGERARALGGVFHLPDGSFTTTINAWMNQARMQMWGSMFAAPSVLPSGFFFSARAGAHPHFLIAQDAGRPWAQPSTPDRPHPHSSQLYSEVHCDLVWVGRSPPFARRRLALPELRRVGVPLRRPAGAPGWGCRGEAGPDLPGAHRRRLRPVLDGLCRPGLGPVHPLTATRPAAFPLASWST